MPTAEQVDRYRWDGHLLPLPPADELRASAVRLARFEHRLATDRGRPEVGLGRLCLPAPTSPEQFPI